MASDPSDEDINGEFETDIEREQIDEPITDGTETPEKDPHQAGSTGNETETGLGENVAGALSYLFGPVTGVLFYLLEDDNEFVRFHAAQSTIIFGGLFVLGIVLTFATTFLAFIPIIGWLIALVLGLASLLIAPFGFVAWVFLMYKAYSGEEYEVPFAGEYARNYAPAEVEPV